MSWTIAIKPMAVDDILGESFLPEVQMGARMRINRRINGTFRVWSLPLAGGRRIVPLDSPPDWRAELDEFLRTRDEFIAQHPSAASFVAAVRAHSDAEQRPSVNIVREITALLAAGSNAEAADVADAAIARGEQGNMSSDTYVTKYLAAYAKCPEAYAAFTASLAPTHEVTRISIDQPRFSTTLMRAHHQGRFAHHLGELDGTETWGFILDVRPPAGSENDPASVRYLRAAGAATGMMIEIRDVGTTNGGAVSVRSVVGHSSKRPGPPDISVTAHLDETISRHEVFTAAEAADIFMAYYRHDALPEGYTLRPVEGYTAAGDAFRF